MPTESRQTRHITLNDDQFVKNFKPMVSPFSANPENEPWNGWMLETYGRDLEHVQSIYAAEPGRVWTIMESDGVMTIESGFNTVNRLGYVITQVAADANTFFSVVDPDDMADDDEDDDSTEDTMG